MFFLSGVLIVKARTTTTTTRVSPCSIFFVCFSSHAMPHSTFWWLLPAPEPEPQHFCYRHFSSFSSCLLELGFVLTCPLQRGSAKKIYATQNKKHIRTLCRSSPPFGRSKKISCIFVKHILSPPHPSIHPIPCIKDYQQQQPLLPSIPPILEKFC